MMTTIVIISHSEEIAKGTKNLLNKCDCLWWSKW